jgi:hypothetical protein
MLAKNTLVHHFKKKTENTESYYAARVSSTVVMCCCMIAAQGVQAAGGCGSAYLPLNALSPDKNPLQGSQYQIGVTVQQARFNQFKEGGKDLTNMGGNEALITQSLLFVNYGVNEKITASVVMPYYP